MNDLLLKKWSDIQDKLRNLSIVAGVDWDQTPNGEYTTNVYIYQDVKLKPFYYKTSSLEEMVEELEIYYLRAENKQKSQIRLDILNSLDWLFIHLFVYGISFVGVSSIIFILYILHDSGILYQILDALK